MTSLHAYLPPHLSPGRRGRIPRRERLASALLLADLSGFTALTDRLEARGREGAERVAEIVEGVFRPAIRSIERRGGSIVAFGGDALFALFPGAGGVRRALLAAEGVRDAVAAAGSVRTAAGAVRLGVAQAIHFGHVDELHLGGAGRRHYLLAGRAVKTVARMEGSAVAGEIVLSRAARVRMAREPTARRRSASRAGRRDADPGRYLDPKIVEALCARVGFRGAYRPASILFLETRGASLRPLQAWFVELERILGRYEGTLLKWDISAEGTIWICGFGIPSALERHGDRAARAALDALRALPRGLAARGGIQGGTVVNLLVGTRSRRCLDVMGDVVNVAARAMGQARWGEVLVTEGVRESLQGVVTEDRGLRALKGKPDPVALHRLVSAASAGPRIRVSASMVGRAGELATLVATLDQAAQGRGEAIAVEGEAGLGKSRLKLEAAIRARERGFAVHEGRAISFGAVPYWTVRALLQDALDIPETADPESVASHVASAARRLGLPRLEEEHLRTLLDPRAGSAPAPSGDPRNVRLNAMAAIRATVVALAAAQPRLLVFEDMHWSDGASAEAVSWLVRAAPGSRLAILLLARPGYQPPAGAHVLRLHDLSPREVADLVGAHLGDAPEDLVRLVAARAGGNPFYVEELVRHFVESGFLAPSGAGHRLLKEPGPADLPATIETLIAARLDRLAGDVKRVAQHAAVVGRSFMVELLAHLPEVAADAFSAIEDLAHRELVFLAAADPHVEYIFKHALTRDVAYASVLAQTRRRLHGVVADALEELLGLDGYEAVVGHHREQAGQRARARAAYLAAARAAAARYALDEAERLYDRHLALAGRNDEDAVVAASELATKVLQQRGRMAEAEELHRRAIDAARTLRRPDLEARSRHLLGDLCRNVGRKEEAIAHYQQSLAHYRREGQREREGQLIGNLAVVTKELGRPEEAEELYRGALAIAREVGDRRQEGIVLGNLANHFNEQGRVGEATRLFGESIELVREVREVAIEAKVLNNLGVLHWGQGRIEEARSIFERVVALDREVGDRRHEGIAVGNLGTLAWEQGRLGEARARFQEGLEIARDTGNRTNEGIVLQQLAALHDEQGRPGEAWPLHEEALVLARATRDRRNEGIVLGQMAESALGSGAPVARVVELATRALEIHRAGGNRRSEASALSTLAAAEHARGAMEGAEAGYRRALELFRDVGDRRHEGTTLVRLARHVLVATGDAARAAELASEAVGVLREGYEPDAGEALCLLGHVALAAGESAAELLAEAGAIAADLEAEGGGDVLSRSVACLQRAQAAFDAGRPLARGRCPEDVEPAVLAWLERRGGGAPS